MCIFRCFLSANATCKYFVPFTTAKGVRATEIPIAAHCWAMLSEPTTAPTVAVVDVERMEMKEMETQPVVVLPMRWKLGRQM